MQIGGYFNKQNERELTENGTTGFWEMKMDSECILKRKATELAEALCCGKCWKRRRKEESWYFDWRNKGIYWKAKNWARYRFGVAMEDSSPARLSGRGLAAAPCEIWEFVSLGCHETPQNRQLKQWTLPFSPCWRPWVPDQMDSRFNSWWSLSWACRWCRLVSAHSHGSVSYFLLPTLTPVVRF